MSFALSVFEARPVFWHSRLTLKISRMSVIALPAFDPESFPESSGIAGKNIELKAKQAFFSQGDAADCVYYLRKGRAKITVVSNQGKEVTITLLAPGDFVGRSRSLQSAEGV